MADVPARTKKTVDAKKREIAGVTRRRRRFRPGKAAREADRLAGQAVLRIEMGARVSFFRAKARKSQNELAREVGCSRIAISNIERGKNGPTIYLLIELAKALRTPVADFFPTKGTTDGRTNTSDDRQAEKGN